jgi:hypothetical protein
MCGFHLPNRRQPRRTTRRHTRDTYPYTSGTDQIQRQHVRNHSQWGSKTEPHGTSRIHRDTSSLYTSRERVYSQESTSWNSKITEPGQPLTFEPRWLTAFPTSQHFYSVSLQWQITILKVHIWNTVYRPERTVTPSFLTRTLIIDVLLYIVDTIVYDGFCWL